MSRVRDKLEENFPSECTKIDERGQWVALALVALVACGVYVNALGNELVYDDRKLIPANELMHDPWRVDRILARPLLGRDPALTPLPAADGLDAGV